ncbi:MAG: DNA-binding LytR/AlgR family response regulator [Polaribacter sp.]|jgi:DNA-binding LytR/AlgR family response regulator
MILKCLIVDDEPPAHKVLESYIEKLNSLSLAGNCYNAIEALNFLHETPVDILFLDINMPELSGLDMLKTLANPPVVILTTAYSEFALEGYEIGVLDYLMKPIRFDRFLKSVNRVLQMKSAPVSSSPTPAETAITPTETSFFVKVDGMQQKVVFSAINYLESKGNFVQLHLGNTRLLTADTLTNMGNKLSPFGFTRVHKSYIVNKEKVSAIEGNQLVIDGTKIPIGNSYRQVVLKELMD